MEVLSVDLGLELLSIFGLLGSAWVISSTLGRSRSPFDRDRNFLQRIFKPRNKIKNIYQLIPILQKNTKKLFLFFSDLATSLRSVTEMSGSVMSRELLEGILSQEYYEQRVTDLQNEVFNEFNVDPHDVLNAIKHFQNDDQVELYVGGVNRMYESLLNSDCVICPGFEPNPLITQDKFLTILEKISNFLFTHTNHTSNTIHTINTSNTINTINLNTINSMNSENKGEMEELLLSELMLYGYEEYLDCMVCLKSVENQLLYDPDYKLNKLKILNKIKKCFQSTIIQKVTTKELHTLCTVDTNSTVLILLFDELIVEESFDKVLRLSNLLHKVNQPNFNLINLINQLDVKLGNCENNENTEKIENNENNENCVNIEEKDEKMGGKKINVKVDRVTENKISSPTISAATTIDTIININTNTNNSVNNTNSVNSINSVNSVNTVESTVNNVDNVENNVILLWMFKREFECADRVKEYPSLVIYKDNQITNVIPIYHYTLPHILIYHNYVN